MVGEVTFAVLTSKPSENQQDDTQVSAASGVEEFQWFFSACIFVAMMAVYCVCPCSRSAHMNGGRHSQYQ